MEGVGATSAAGSQRHEASKQQASSRNYTPQEKNPSSIQTTRRMAAWMKTSTSALYDTRFCCKMTKDVQCCLPTDIVKSAAKMMRSEDVGSIPVVQSQRSKKLLGIVTDRDLALKVVAEGQESTLW